MQILDTKTVEAILADAVAALNAGSWRPPGGAATASAFEKEAQRQLQHFARAHGVENKIILHAGRKFPDIVFENSKFGVEIKTAQKGWSCLGNSVAASTLVDGVDQVYLMFGSGIEDFEVRYSLYEDSIKSVEVTHSPRYMLDMDVQPDASYLRRIGKNLSGMLSMEDPISCIVDEARRNLKPGEHLWWISERAASPLTIRTWNSIAHRERRKLVATGFALFPSSILGGNEADYTDFVVWLAQEHSIFHPCVRDSYTAGKHVPRLEFGVGYLENTPSIFKRLRSHMAETLGIIRDGVTIEAWAKFYNCSAEDCDTPVKRFRIWRATIEPLLIDRMDGQEYAITCIRSFLEENSRDFI